MSNIAGKSYAMNVITPIKWTTVWVNKLIFWAVRTNMLRFVGASLDGLTTLSLIHYARWAIIKPKQFPRLDESQPKEDIEYSYMLFHSNFNGSWEQYVDSFHTSIPTGLNLFWYKNVLYPGSVPLKKFHDYITYNQIWTSHYYNAYPTAASNDVKAAKNVKAGLLNFMDETQASSAVQFKSKYDELILSLQADLSIMEATPIVSLAAQAVALRQQ